MFLKIESIQGYGRDHIIVGEKRQKARKMFRLRLLPEPLGSSGSRRLHQWARN